LQKHRPPPGDGRHPDRIKRGDVTGYLQNAEGEYSLDSRVFCVTPENPVILLNFNIELCYTEFNI
ncbi:MAG: hypothetical protein ACOCWZ_07225, partial [Spirochaetota bacterium]